MGMEEGFIFSCMFSGNDHNEFSMWVAGCSKLSENFCPFAHVQGIWILCLIFNIWYAVHKICEKMLSSVGEPDLEQNKCFYVILFSNLMHYFFIKSTVFLYMFRAILCFSSGGLNCIYTASGSWFRQSGNK